MEKKEGTWEKFSSGLRDSPLLKGALGLGDTLGVNASRRWLVNMQNRAL